MTGFLLDTNVVSETMRMIPDSRVSAFLDEHDDLWLPSIVIHELEFGVLRLPQGNRRTMLRQALQRLVSEYDNRILPLDRAGAMWAAEFRARERLAGRTLDLGDALVAGTARAHDLPIATRNISDFHHLDIVLIDPWN